MTMYHFTIRTPDEDIDYSVCARDEAEAQQRAEYFAKRKGRKAVVVPDERRVS